MSCTTSAGNLCKTAAERETVSDNVPSDHLDLPPSPHQRRKGIRTQDLPSGEGPFPDLPNRQAKVLIRSGFRTRLEVMQTPNEELLRVPGISRWTLELIRQRYPFVPEALLPLMICPCCGGLGRVRRFEFEVQNRKYTTTLLRQYEQDKEEPT